MKSNRNDIEGRASAPCSASSDTPETNKFRASLDGMREINQRDQLLSHARKMERERNRLTELLEDYERDKRQIGKDLGLSEDDQMHHRFQRRAIMDLQMLIREAKRIQNTDAPSYEQFIQHNETSPSVGANETKP